MQNPNCCIDTSGYGHDRVGMLEYAVKTIGPDRILFGSDFSINDPSTVIARVHNAFLTEEQRRKSLGRICWPCFATFKLIRRRGY